MQNGSVSPAVSLDLPGTEQESCSLPSPGALSSASPTARPPGLNKLEQFLREKKIIARNQVANPDWLELQSGLPIGWTDPLESRVAAELLASEGKRWATRLTPESLTLLSSESATCERSQDKPKCDRSQQPVAVQNPLTRLISDIAAAKLSHDGLLTLRAALDEMVQMRGLSLERSPYNKPSKNRSISHPEDNTTDVGVVNEKVDLPPQQLLNRLLISIDALQIQLEGIERQIGRIDLPAEQYRGCWVDESPGRGGKVYHRLNRWKKGDGKGKGKIVRDRKLHPNEVGMVEHLTKLLSQQEELMSRLDKLRRKRDRAVKILS